MTHPIARTITPQLLAALEVNPVLFLNGPRQAGKSTLVQALAPHFTSGTVDYVSLDHSIQAAAAALAPEAFLSKRAGTLIIDEAQLAPELFRVLKTVVDKLRREDPAHANGRFLLTGSANILALPKLADSLVGRMSVLTLYPFCMAEALALKGVTAKGNAIHRLFQQEFSGLHSDELTVIEAITYATFPEISGQSTAIQKIWCDGYLSTLLQRDVRQLSELEKIAVLPGLLRILATRAGSLLNDADIARAVRLNPVTGKVYRTLLGLLFLTIEIMPWFRNLGKRLTKSPKGYLIDSVLLCHLLDLELSDLWVKKPEFFGHLVENFVASELTKLLSSGNVRAQLLHFRTTEGKEVDFVLEKPNGELVGIEVKSSEQVTAHDFRGLQLLSSLTGKDFVCGVVLYQGRAVVPFGENLWAVPLCLLWQ